MNFKELADKLDRYHDRVLMTGTEEDAAIEAAAILRKLADGEYIRRTDDDIVEARRLVERAVGFKDYWQFYPYIRELAAFVEQRYLHE